MSRYKIKALIKSGAIFGSGKSKGQIHEDSQYDEDGFIYYNGKTFKGMLRKSGEFIVDSYKSIEELKGKELEESFIKLFGSRFGEGRKEGILRFSNLEVSDEVKSHFKNLPSDEVLELMTEVNSFIRIGENGVTEESSLRSIRVVKKDMVFWCELGELSISTEEEKLLALIVKNTRALGMNLSKGRGEVEMNLVKLIDGKNKLIKVDARDVIG